MESERTMVLKRAPIAGSFEVSKGWVHLDYFFLSAGRRLARLTVGERGRVGGRSRSEARKA